MIHILIADDHSLVRKGLHQILKEGFPNAVIEEVSDSDAIINNILQKKYDVIISDLSMPGKSGLEVIPQIKEIHSGVPVLILSIHPKNQYAVRVLKAGASGYLSKDLAPEELVSAVKTVLQGKRYITSEIAHDLALNKQSEKSKPTHLFLSDREFDVMKMIAVGKSISEIADSMSLSATTVSTYRSRILTKMNFKNNADIILYAIENKLIAPPIQ